MNPSKLSLAGMTVATLLATSFSASSAFSAQASIVDANALTPSTPSFSVLYHEDKAEKKDTDKDAKKKEECKKDESKNKKECKDKKEGSCGQGSCGK